MLMVCWGGYFSWVELEIGWGMGLEKKLLGRPKLYIMEGFVGSAT